MKYRTDDLRIREIKELLPPAKLLADFPITEKAARIVYETRQEIHRILHGANDRALLIAGPCSIHDTKAAKEYATLLKEAKDRFAPDLLILMRVYFEKPRTTVGWKGLINDPNLDGSFQINDGLRLARRLLLELNEAGMPAGCEFLDMITPQYFADLVSWGAIGARTTESQVHRELASGLSCPCRFQKRHRRQRAHCAGCDSRLLRRRIIFFRSQRPAIQRSFPLPATRIAISSCAAANSQITMRRTSMRRPKILRKPAFRRAS
jgi:3-deoxy-7-phosphoheptulonate synthase